MYKINFGTKIKAGEIALIDNRRYLICGSLFYNKQVHIIIPYNSYIQYGKTETLVNLLDFLDLRPKQTRDFNLVPLKAIQAIKPKNKIYKGFFCSHCGMIINKRVRSNHNKYISLCENCLSRFYVIINGKYTHRREAIKVKVDNFDNFASKENITSYKRCEVCNELYSGQHYCNYPVQDYGVKFGKEVLKKLDSNVLYFGIEHETNIDDQYNREETRECFANDIREAFPSYFLTKYDSSISGIEIVSRPLTFEQLENFDWLRYFNLVNDYCGDTSQHGAGIHIHVSRNQVTNKQLYLMLKFLYLNKERIINFCGRTESLMQHWSVIENNLYYNYKLRNNNLPHGYCISSTEQTLEFRIFNSTLSRRTFRAYYQFVKAFLEYTKQLNSLDLNWSSLVKFVESQKGLSALKYIINHY